MTPRGLCWLGCGQFLIAAIVDMVALTGWGGGEGEGEGKGVPLLAAANRPPKELLSQERASITNPCKNRNIFIPPRAGDVFPE